MRVAAWMWPCVDSARGLSPPQVHRQGQRGKHREAATSAARRARRARRSSEFRCSGFTVTRNTRAGAGEELVLCGPLKLHNNLKFIPLVCF